MFQSLDGDALSRFSSAFVRADAASGHIAIDDKTLRGSRGHNAKVLDVVSAFSTALSAVVCKPFVALEQNEITVARALLKGLPLDGTIISDDTIICQRQLGQHMRDRREHDLFAVTDNKPAMQKANAENCGGPFPALLRRAG